MSVSQIGQEKKIFLSVSMSASMAEQEQKYSRQCVCPRARQVRNRTPVREYVFWTRQSRNRNSSVIRYVGEYDREPGEAETEKLLSVSMSVSQKQNSNRNTHVSEYVSQVDQDPTYFCHPVCQWVCEPDRNAFVSE